MQILKNNGFNSGHCNMRIIHFKHPVGSGLQHNKSQQGKKTLRNVFRLFVFPCQRQYYRKWFGLGFKKGLH